MTYPPQQPQSGPVPPYGTQPPVAGFPSAPVSAKSRKWPWILGGFVGVMLIGCMSVIASGGGSAPTADPAAATEGTAAEAAADPKTTEKVTKKDETPGLNQPVRDGKFEFTVTGVKCGVGRVGSSLVGQQAQGQFCLISLTIKNIGGEAQTFADSVQKAYNAEKTEYSVDSSAALYANGENQVLFTEINPGNTVKGKLVFDIPKGTKLTKLDLHDSIFSGGVKVALR